MGSNSMNFLMSGEFDVMCLRSVRIVACISVWSFGLLSGTLKFASSRVCLSSDDIQ